MKRELDFFKVGGGDQNLRLKCTPGGGNSNIFKEFSHRKLGKIRTHLDIGLIFFKWVETKNHQLVLVVEGIEVDFSNVW